MLETTLDFVKSRPKSLIASVVGMLVVAAWLMWPRHIPLPVAQPSEGPAYRLLAKELRDGDLLPLPGEFTEHAGKRLPGRPDVPLPISEVIYDHVELKIDGQPLSEPLVLQGGSTVHIAGDIFAKPEMPRNIIMDCEIGLISKAQNQRGFIIHDLQFKFSYNCRERHSTFEGDFEVPDVTGEYLLAVLSCARVGYPTEYPALLAGEFDVVIE